MGRRCPRLRPASISHAIVAPGPTGVMPNGSDAQGGVMEGDRPRPLPAPDPDETPGGRAGRKGRPRPPHPNGLNGRGRAVPSVMPGVVPTSPIGGSPSPSPRGTGGIRRVSNWGHGPARRDPRRAHLTPDPPRTLSPRQARTRAGTGQTSLVRHRHPRASPHAGGDGCRLCAGTARTF